jgi:hypothetical protein
MVTVMLMLVIALMACLMFGLVFPKLPKPKSDRGDAVPSMSGICAMVRRGPFNRNLCNRHLHHHPHDWIDDQPPKN